MAEIVEFPQLKNSPSNGNTYTTDSINHVESAIKHKEAASVKNSRLSSTHCAEIAQNILKEIELLHSSKAIDTSTFNKVIHLVSPAACGEMSIDPEPPLAS